MEPVKIQITFPEAMSEKERALVAELIKLALTRDVAPHFWIAHQILNR